MTDYVNDLRVTTLYEVWFERLEDRTTHRTNYAYATLINAQETVKVLNEVAPHLNPRRYFVAEATTTRKEIAS